ncbi:GNAT family N-acetyltransferase [Streptomyces sp. NPDC059979]|uniref:GNAT family N-acetyltransferase n=1 Tax=Streptomyces sp. NPDC059979 TaxID=3347021 RepID=UPI0036C9A197
MHLPKHTIPLDGLTLRAFNAQEDLPEFFRVIEESLEHLRPWMPWVAGHSLAATTAFLTSRAECWASGDEFTYAIVWDGNIVGSCSLIRRSETPENGREIGYWLHPAATGRGVVTRGARALVEQAFRMPGIDYVEVVHDPANHASGAVPARLGFTEHLRRPAERHAPADTGEEQVWRLTRHQTKSLTSEGTC